MRLAGSSEGDEHVRRTNELLASEERLGRWVVLCEAVVDQLRRSGRDFESSTWLAAPPQAALAALKEWAVSAIGSEKLSELPQELLEEPAAATPRGQTYIERVREALPIAYHYQLALWADHDWELRQDFGAIFRELDAWRRAQRDSGVVLRQEPTCRVEH